MVIMITYFEDYFLARLLILPAFIGIVNICFVGILGLFAQDLQEYQSMLFLPTPPGHIHAHLVLLRISDCGIRDILLVALVF